MGAWCPLWALSKWCKTMQRSQRSAGGDSGSVGRPLRHILSGCRMTAQAQLVLNARAATGRSVQVIKPFMHSSTHPQAFYINSLCKVTPVHHCTRIALILLSCTPSMPLSHLALPFLLSFSFFSLTNPRLNCWLVLFFYCIFTKRKRRRPILLLCEDFNRHSTYSYLL